jgi:hypothetical protein
MANKKATVTQVISLEVVVEFEGESPMLTTVVRALGNKSGTSFSGFELERYQITPNIGAEHNIRLHLIRTLLESQVLNVVEEQLNRLATDVREELYWRESEQSEYGDY